MSTYDDFDGVWFTIQSICLYHPEVLRDISFVVIDNHPEGLAADALQALGHSVPNYRYVPFAGFRGTSVRDLLFREAKAEIVCCVDSHVLVAPGALAAVQSWFSPRPDSRDLLQGPIVWDDLRGGVTHMEPIWRDGMFGAWPADSRLGDAGGEPFEIEMHGLGLFACRRDAWPGINARFRGFGGEEGYLHEKFRRNGGRVLCHPAVRWVHRFGRPAGTHYPNRWEDRVRNYLLGWSEIGWDLSPAQQHFRALLGERCGPIWEEARAQVEHPLSMFDGVFCLSANGGSCDAHHHPESVAWRIERVAPDLSAADLEWRRASAWRTALRQAERRGYESVLLIDAATAEIDVAPARELPSSERPWDVCLLAAGDGQAVGVHGRAFAGILSDLGDGAGGCAQFLDTWGDLDNYLRQRVMCGPLTAGGVPFASAGSERLTVAAGVDALERDHGITVRRASRGRVYDLNHTASIVLHLCDGKRTVVDIANELADIFKLAAAPLPEVSTCVQQLRHAGILTGIGG